MEIIGNYETETLLKSKKLQTVSRLKGKLRYLIKIYNLLVQN